MEFKYVVFRVDEFPDEEIMLEEPVLFPSLKAARNYKERCCCFHKYIIHELSTPIFVDSYEVYHG